MNSLKIEITNNLIEFFLIVNDDEVRDYFLNNHHSYFLDIQFFESIFKICTGNKTNTEGLITEFVSEIIENPESYTTYKIQFCGKEYQLTGECLLAIVLNELITNSKKQLEQDYIDNIDVEINTDEVDVPLIAYLRIKEALKYIEYNNLETYCYYSEDTTSEEETDYEETVEIMLEEMNQKEQFNDIIKLNRNNREKSSIIQKYLDDSVIVLSSMRNMDRNNQYEYELDGIIQQLNHMKKPSNYSDKEMKKLGEIVREYEPEVLPLSLKRLFNYNQLDQYTMFLSMMYLDSIDDMINVVFASKRFEHIFQKFHFNPVSINETTIQFFPKLRMLRLYSTEDKMIKNEQIQRT